jgi:hypothetical protein
MITTMNISTKKKWSASQYKGGKTVSQHDNSYFHMSCAVRSLFRYEAEIQAEYLKTDSARILNNIFRVRLGKVLKNINLL